MTVRTFASALIAFALPCAALAQETQPVTLKFAAEFAGKPFACGARIEGIGLGKATVDPVDFRLYLSGIELLKADGAAVPVALEQDGKWQVKSVALLDFENGTGGCVNGTPDMRAVVTGTVPKGVYTGLRFTIGVPFDLNHADPTLAPSPLNLTAMFWNWQGGYKFVKVDLATGPAMPAGGHDQPAPGAVPAAKAPVKASGFSIHLGSTLCQSPSKTSAPTACANANRVTVSLPNADPARSTVVFDPAPVLAAVDVSTNTPETSPGCMSFPNDPECLTVMPKLGLAYADRPAEAQVFARVR